MRPQGVIRGVLLALCAAGLLVSWISGNAAWQLFQLVVDVLVLAWFVGWVAGAFQKSHWPWLLIPFLAIIAWGTVQLYMGWTVYRFATRMEILRWGTFASVFFLGFQTVDEDAPQRRFCRLTAIYGFALAMVSLFQYFLGNGKIFWLFTPTENASGFGPFLNYDHFASFIALVLPAAAFEMRRGRHWFYVLATAGLYAAALASTSRAGFALVTLEVLILLVLLRFPGKVVGAITALVIVFALVVGWESLYQRYNVSDPYAGRREIAEASVRMIRATPWKGTGLGTWTDVYPAYAQRDLGATINAAHNDWLQWAGDGGIPFACLVLVLFVGSITYVRRAPWALGVPIIFLHSLIDFPLQGRFLPAAVFLMLGVAARASGSRRERKAGPRPPKAATMRAVTPAHDPQG